MAKNKQDIFEGIRATGIVEDINSLPKHSAKTPFYIVCKSIDLAKSIRQVTYYMEEFGDDTYMLSSPEYAISAFNFPKFVSTNFANVLLKLNKDNDISIVYANEQRLELIMEISKGNLTLEQAKKVTLLMTKLPTDNTLEYYVKDVETIVGTIQDASKSFTVLLRRGYLESGEVIDGPVRREMEYLFGEYGMNHACNKWYLIEAENLKSTSILDNDIFTYECFPYIKEIRDGDELIEHSPMLCDSTINPSRMVALFANVNNTDPMKKGYPNEEGSIKFFGVYECLYKGKDECVEFKRTATVLDILSIRLTQRLAQLDSSLKEGI